MPVWLLILLGILILSSGGIVIAKTMKRVSLEEVLPIVLKVSKKYDLSPALFLAIMKKESGLDTYSFNANAFKLELDWWRNNVKTGKCRICLQSKWAKDPLKWGSWGLMQIHFPTALEYAFNQVNNNPEILLNIEFNIDLAGRILKDLWEKYNGTLRDIFSAYNSGKPYRDAPYITKFQYVLLVEENYNFYKKLLKQRGVL